jgi:succinylglutamic semialdehyde dehydrogenase
MKHYINGHWITGSGEEFESIDPATGESLCFVHHAEDKEVQTAVDAAHNALTAWANLSIESRIDYLHKFHSNLEQNTELLAESISQETGKPLWEAKTEVATMLAKIEISIKAYGDRCAQKSFEAQGGMAALRYKPHGVVAVFGAFNFPGHLSNGHIVPALLAGNTVVYKASEYAPMVAQRIMQCWHQTGIPHGVINLLQGGRSTGEALLKKKLNGVYFTGSYATGKAIHQNLAGKPETILALELGGNNPLVIDEFSDPTAAAYTTLISAYITAGQRCTCARRVIIPKGSAGDSFLNCLLEMISKIKVGAYNDIEKPFMGPVISSAAALSHLDEQQALIESGGKPLLEMKLLKPNTGFLSPGLIDMSEVESPKDNELFAPLIQLYRYENLEQAIDYANNTDYGLAAGILTEDKQKFETFYQKVNAGLINWNRPLTGASSALPFGGIGKSGNHRPSAYFAADYCAYPIASLEHDHLDMPQTLIPGLHI